MKLYLVKNARDSQYLPEIGLTAKLKVFMISREP